TPRSARRRPARRTEFGLQAGPRRLYRAPAGAPGGGASVPPARSRAPERRRGFEAHRNGGYWSDEGGASGDGAGASGAWPGASGPGAPGVTGASTGGSVPPSWSTLREAPPPMVNGATKQSTMRAVPSTQVAFWRKSGA